LGERRGKCVISPHWQRWGIPHLVRLHLRVSARACTGTRSVSDHALASISLLERHTTRSAPQASADCFQRQWCVVHDRWAKAHWQKLEHKGRTAACTLDLIIANHQHWTMCAWGTCCRQAGVRRAAQSACGEGRQAGCVGAPREQKVKATVARVAVGLSNNHAEAMVHWVRNSVQQIGYARAHCCAHRMEISGTAVNACAPNAARGARKAVVVRGDARSSETHRTKKNGGGTSGCGPCEWGRKRTGTCAHWIATCMSSVMGDSPAVHAPAVSPISPILAAGLCCRLLSVKKKKSRFSVRPPASHTALPSPAARLPPQHAPSICRRVLWVGQDPH
jgi:hypothetical protein